MPGKEGGPAHDRWGRCHPEDSIGARTLPPQFSRAGSSIKSPYFFIFL